jgi:glutathione S-transferase
MVLKLYGLPLSGNTQRVALIAKERNIPYEVVSVDLRAGEHKQPMHVEHHPFGQVPYIIVRASPTQPFKSFVYSDGFTDE